MYDLFSRYLNVDIDYHSISYTVYSINLGKKLKKNPPREKSQGKKDKLF